MAWSNDLKEKMAKKSWTPAFILSLRSVLSEDTEDTWIPWAAGTMPPDAGLSDDSVRIGSIPRTKDTTHAATENWLDPQSIEMPMQRVSLDNFTWSGNQWSVTVGVSVGDDEIVNRLVPGAFVALSIGDPSYKMHEYRRIAMGLLEEVMWVKYGARLVISDLLMVSNADRAHVPENFGYTTTTCSLTSNYTAGDSTLDVDDTSAFLPDGDGVYTLRLQPLDEPAFLVHAAGATATSFTGVSGARYNTTAVDIATGTGSEIKQAFRVEGHPADMIAQVLTSTGLGTNGANDTEPAAVGYGLPECLVDTADMDVWRPTVDPVTGAIAFDLPVWNSADAEETYPDGRMVEGSRSMLAWLGQVGIMAVERQGQYTMRALQAGVGLGGEIDSGVTIQLKDVVEFKGVDQWKPPWNYEYTTFEVREDGSLASAVNEEVYLTRPGAGTATVDLTGYLTNNQAAVVESIADRVGPYVTGNLEVLKIRLGGLHWYKVCILDIVTLGDLTALTRPYGPMDAARGRTDSTYLGYNGQKAMVIGRRMELPWPSVYLELAILPWSGSFDIPALNDGG